FHAWRESDAWDSSALFSKKSNAGPLAFRICLLNRSKAFQFHATKRICTNVGPGCCLNGGGRGLGKFSGAGMQESDRRGGEGGSVFDRKLLVDVMQMNLDGTIGDIQPTANLLVRQSFGY